METKKEKNIFENKVWLEGIILSVVESHHHKGGEDQRSWQITIYTPPTDKVMETEEEKRYKLVVNVPKDACNTEPKKANWVKIYAEVISGADRSGEQAIKIVVKKFIQSLGEKECK